MHSCPAAHVPQLGIFWPQPSAAAPHSMPWSVQLFGWQVVGVHFPPMHVSPVGHVGHSIWLPH
jgi:hypothetical protein